MKSSVAILLACFARGSAVLLKRASPDVAAEVAEQAMQNIHISDTFQSQEDVDVKQEKKIKADVDFSALQLGARGQGPEVKDPCGGITCGALTCPAGFSETKMDGHCCPYCVNPNIKVEAAVTGATGSHGGKASTFCDNVWCFPTMCTKAIQAATTTNGQCCDVCP
eukprot:TRINITY_DN2756_c0_g2_i1.p3 TRINITY_DN2756_c0_g2~~TRINITY_DN2756_c0_g2_i1.p3  ORF type:complete len:166 (-),score=56.20 TRINITY_DN2756_c0_g2_i1:95-592(-)